MRDGLPPKLGDWYEEGYLVLQLLELLSERNLRVDWEPGVPGLDIEIHRDGADIGIQCKHRSPTAKWNLRDLGREGVLAYTRRYLEPDNRRTYRFVTDRPASVLEQLAESARKSARPAEWWEEQGTDALKLAEEWGIDPQAPETPDTVHGLARRIHVQLLNSAAIDSQCRALAELQAGGRADELLDVLRRVGRTHAETRTSMWVEDLRAAIEEAGVVLQPRAFDRHVHDRLADLALSFRAGVAEIRYLDKIARGEVQVARDALDSMEEPGTLLIHGLAGCGKTEIISELTKVLEDQGWVTLATTPDRLPDLDLNADPVATLKRHAGTRPAILVLDQLDTVLWAGAKTRTLLVPAREAILRARDYGVYVVAGCRTIDAIHETQLQQMLRNRAGEAPEMVAVGDLDEATTGKVLSGAGIALADLHHKVRKLAGRPLYLRLICRLLERRVDLRRVTGLPRLMREWWTQIGQDLSADEIDVFDEIVDRMEREGRLRVCVEGLSRPEALPALVRGGLITVETRQKDGSELARPTHQVLVDMRIAHRWRDIGTPGELLKKLGGKEEQSFHTARRLRLAIPLLRDHTRAVECLRAIVESPDVRPLVKHSLFKALSEVEDPRTAEVKLLTEWYRDERFGSRIMATVARGSPVWIEGLHKIGWLNAVWAAGEQDLVLDLLASVSASWGDGVAALLGTWYEKDPEVLDRASWIFLQAPGKDTDALFELRLVSAARGSVSMPLARWSELLSTHPERALRLLAARLPHESIDSICRGDVEWSQLFPGSKDPSLAAASRIGSTAWTHLRDWWCELSGIDMDRVQTADGVLPEAFLVRIVELLARCLAFALDSGEFTWRDLVRDLPHPLRDHDGWLMLRTGTALKKAATGVPEAVIRWLQSEQRWSEIQVGYHGLRWDLAAECARTVSELASDDGYRELEGWILAYQDRWNAQDEERRWRDHKEYGPLRPSHRGALAYHLLPRLPERRKSTRARQLLRELKRKFDQVRGSTFRRYGISGGRVVPRVQPQIAARWSPSEWKIHLTQATERGRWPAEQQSPSTIHYSGLNKALRIHAASKT